MIIHKRYCRICATKDNLNKSGVYRRKTGDISQRYMCRNCNASRLRKIRTTPEGMALFTKAVKRYNQENPERLHAWYAAQWKHKKLQPCEVCGEPRTHRHHPDPKKPQEIRFLCPLHHKEAHRKEAAVSV